MTGSYGGVCAFLRERLVDDRDLAPEEIERLVEDLAGHPEAWRGLVRHSEEERIYERIHRDHHLEAWLICWMGEQETGLHDHDVSSGAVRVVEGRLAEDRLVLGGDGLVTTVYEAGGGFRFDATRIHDVRHVGDLPSVSLHLYSPPLWRMGYYEIADDGRIARRSASYAEELQAG
jgi:hypothetical protein